MSKSTILMLPTWYPTKDNPINGVFFREQAIAMQKDFDFVVATYHESAECCFLSWFRKVVMLPPPA